MELCNVFSSLTSAVFLTTVILFIYDVYVLKVRRKHLDDGVLLYEKDPEIMRRKKGFI